MFADTMWIRSRVEYELRDALGRLKQHGVMHNLITTNGDQHCAKLLYSSPTAMTAVKLGTGTTVPAKSGAGSYIGTGDYVSGSAHACDESSPKVGASANITQFIHTWGAGEATNPTINRAAIVNNINDAGEADAAGTLAIVLFDPKPVAKGATDTLKVTWTETFLGA